MIKIDIKMLEILNVRKTIPGNTDRFHLAGIKDYKEFLKRLSPSNLSTAVR